jgi:hypothetical protein
MLGTANPARAGSIPAPASNFFFEPPAATAENFLAIPGAGWNVETGVVINQTDFDPR